jgi:hypothetical protein
VLDADAMPLTPNPVNNNWDPHQPEGDLNPKVEDAPVATRKRKRRAMQVDDELELHHAELRQRNIDYLQNMEAAKARNFFRVAAHAKVNARQWVFQNGISEIGRGMGGAGLVHSELATFFGADLLTALGIGSMLEDEGVDIREIEDEQLIEDQLGRPAEVGLRDHGEEFQMIFEEEGVSWLKTYSNWELTSRQDRNRKRRIGPSGRTWFKCHALERFFVD